jgi:DNA-binding NtrC family response regulator
VSAIRRTDTSTRPRQNDPAITKTEVSMGLREFLTANREDIELACSADIVGMNNLERWQQCACDFLAEIAANLASKRERGTPASLELVGSGPCMTRLRAMVGQLAARSRAAVLVLGERGTGRRQCARALHAATYPEGDMFELSAVTQLGELESRLASLRDRVGAPSAFGLTVYVHEICEAPAEAQFQVSRLLLERRLPLRVVVSSERPLAAARWEGRLRPELAFGFANVLELAPLRERAADIAALCQHFARLDAMRYGSPALTFSSSALLRMREYGWPGNVTELKNLMEKLSRRAHGRVLELEDLPELGERTSDMFFVLPPNGIEFAELERVLLMQALAMAHNNQTRAASLLGLTRDQMRYRIAKFELQTTADRAAE